MPVFKFVVSDPKNKKSYQLEVDQEKCSGLIGKRIYEEFNGDLIGLPGYKLQITGGTDKDGFPMHPRLKGQGKKKLLLSSPPGFHPGREGERRRKTVRGNTISPVIAQINVKVIGSGEKPLGQLLKKPGVKKEEKKPKKKEKKRKKKKKKPKGKKKKKKEEKEEKSGGEKSKEKGD